MYVTRRKNIMRTHVPRKQFPIVHERVFEKFVPLLNHPHTSSKVKRSAPKRNSRKLCSFWRWSSSIEVTPAHSLSQGDKSGPEFHQGVDMHPFFFFIRMLFFRPRLNILIFSADFGLKYSCEYSWIIGIKSGLCRHSVRLFVLSWLWPR